MWTACLSINISSSSRKVSISGSASKHMVNTVRQIWAPNSRQTCRWKKRGVEWKGKGIRDHFSLFYTLPCPNIGGIGIKKLTSVQTYLELLLEYRGWKSLLKQHKILHAQRCPGLAFPLFIAGLQGLMIVLASKGQYSTCWSQIEIIYPYRGGAGRTRPRCTDGCCGPYFELTRLGLTHTVLIKKSSFTP